jgi:thiazole/oxazole-forming peptide maturase SagD family component
MIMRLTTRPSSSLRKLSRLASNQLGIVSKMSFLRYDDISPTVCVSAGSMADIQVIKGHLQDVDMEYHVGGMSSSADHSVLIGYAEAGERYSHISAPSSNSAVMRRGSYDDLTGAGLDLLCPDTLRYFSEEQVKRPGFGFSIPSRSETYQWIPTRQLWDGREVFAPLQILAIAAQIGNPQYERPFVVSVTTGTAVHTTPILAAENALNELLQLDAAMGNWHTQSDCLLELSLDGRTAPFQHFMGKFAPHMRKHLRFYFMRNPGLDGPFNIACVFHSADRCPALAIGMGSDKTLNQALRKSLMEMSGVYQLAALNLVRFNGQVTDSVLNLDGNVAYYAKAEHAEKAMQAFAHARVVNTADLPADFSASSQDYIAHQVRALHANGVDLYEANFQCRELTEVGLTVSRLWSPQLLPLNVPSLPYLAHPRLAAFGTLAYPGMHPYP